VFAFPVALVGLSMIVIASLLSTAISERISNGYFIPDMLFFTVIVMIFAICVVGYIIASVFPNYKSNIEKNGKVKEEINIIEQSDEHTTRCPKCNEPMLISAFTGNYFCPFHGELIVDIGE
jgi:hypothetical protein